jgi:hypothetical protein
MEIAEAQLEMRSRFAGGFYGHIVSGLLWVGSAALASWSSPRAAITALVLGGFFIFPMTELLVRTAGRRPPLSTANSLRQLGMQVAFVLPASMLLLLPVGLYRLNWFYPAMMILLGAHYLPFVFLYGMRMFAALAALLVGVGVLIALSGARSFAVGAWVTGCTLLVFAIAGKILVRRESSRALRTLATVLVASVAAWSIAGHATLSARGSDSRITIDLARGTPKEQLAKQTLEQVLASHDLKKYTFTRRVVIEQGAVNHAFPVLTLNPYFASSPDELLSTYIHEQLHWHLRDRAAELQAAIAELRRMYPHVPVGLPASAENEYSTYGHLVDCYLEILADRELLGPERTDVVIHGKPWYTWIYTTVLADEKQIAGVVDRHRLRVP